MSRFGLSFCSKKPKEIYLSLVLIALNASAFAGSYYQSYSELPAGSFPALYFWQWDKWVGGGDPPGKPEYDVHPGYFSHGLFKNANLDWERGYLKEHPSSLQEVFDVLIEVRKKRFAELGLEVLSISEPFIERDGALWRGGWKARVLNTNKGTEYEANFLIAHFYRYSGRSCPFSHAQIYLQKKGKKSEAFCVLFSGSLDKEKNYGRPLSCNGTNPIHGVTGNKFQSEYIYQSSSNSQLRLDIFYNSQNQKERISSTFSRTLSNTIDNVLQNQDETRYGPKSPYLSIAVKRDDGRMFRFSNRFDFNRNTTIDTHWAPPPGVSERLQSINDIQTGEIVGLELTTIDGTKERYSNSGRLLEVKTPQGHHLTIQNVSDTQSIIVTDIHGRFIEIERNGRRPISLATDSGVYRFEYTLEGDLIGVIYPSYPRIVDTLYS